ncbi:lasso RiPP family leader peptide-containing protein [Dyadobacter flavalbus]|uniref:Lasso RiPP family leader peptide-containing protein n=1 Tax=Dyadobacter flavalbus TaxID=2579942 RepID=A0A5M8QWU3_9BACT|nr:lasso RiPP family leader peptide-containing protein [Dyadobacter flavalbus]KAA6440649.1 lasso RiPP family leader peptide-containing protein [Dyadobacter flavalbus]
MRTVTSHSTQTKKAYRKPVLKKHGNVSKLTKGKLGSLPDLTPPDDFSSEG